MSLEGKAESKVTLKGSIVSNTQVMEALNELNTQMTEALAEHENKRNNPHGVTCAQINAAPAGYGLGGSGVPFAVADIDNMKSNGWFFGSSATGYKVGNSTLYYLFLRVDSWKDGVGSSYVLHTLHSDGNEYKRYCKNGTWSEWYTKD
jgi:hypothetical protein